MEEKETNNTRTRNFATIVYKESAPSNWQEILAEELVPVLISPYHDKDINPTGEVKKPHWHVLIMFDGVKSLRQAQAIVNKIGGVGCRMINSLRGYARYLCHLDNPEKFQYDQNDVVELCGADYQETIQLQTDRYKIIQDMCNFCEDKDIISFYKLSRYAIEHNESWKRALFDNSTIFMKEYLKSRKWTLYDRKE